MERLKKKARARVDSEVRKGRLVRPTKCSKCKKSPALGSDGRSCIHAHHHKGYEQPLDIVWLCVKCHLAEDGRPSGEENGRAKLTEAAASDIRSSNAPRDVLLQKYGISKTQYYRIRRGETWRDLGVPLPAKEVRLAPQFGAFNPRANFTDESVAQMLACARMGESNVSIARRLNLNRDCVWRITARRTWKHISEEKILNVMGI